MKIMDKIRPLLDDLQTILLNEMDLYRELLSILKKEKDVIIELSVDEIMKCIKEKETLGLKLRMLEESRITIIKSLSDRLNIQEEDIKLSRLSEIVDEPYSSQFKRYSSDIRALIKDINEINRYNKEFIEHSLTSIRGSLALLNQLISPNLTYLQTGELECGEYNGKVFSAKV
jgi:flagellar biosynthesis/type III secretory pathway chaperone